MMDEATERERLSQGYEDEGDVAVPQGGAQARWAPERAWLIPFAIGVLLGWIVLGWWLWPVTWTDAYPADLAAAYRADYVHMVSDAYVRRPDADLAARRLASFDAPTLQAVLDAQAGQSTDPIAAENARQLARAMATAGVIGTASSTGAGAGTGSRSAADGRAGAGATAGTVVTSTTAPAPGAGTTLARLRRPGFWLGLLALAALGGVAALFLRRPEPPGADDPRLRMARRRARLAARDRGGMTPTDALRLDDLAEAPGDAATDGLVGGESAPAAGAPRETPQRTGRLPLPSLPDDTSALPMPRAPWQRSGEAGLGPGKLDFGGTASVLYDSGDEHFYQTWLVYDEREGLSASINIQARKVGSLTSLDVWLYDRDVTGDPSSTPLKVAILAQAASQEAHLRALLRDRQILPAVPGAQTVLEVGELSLEITVTDVAPPPEAGSLKIDRLRLALTPFRYPQEPRLDGDDSGVGGDGGGGRAPIQFRREEG